MAKYKIEFKNSVLKEIHSIPQKDLKKILTKIKSLSENPRQTGCKKLSTQERYRIRYGDYRILYSIDDNILIIYIVMIGHRRYIYKQ